MMSWEWMGRSSVHVGPDTKEQSVKVSRSILLQACHSLVQWWSHKIILPNIYWFIFLSNAIDKYVGSVLLNTRNYKWIVTVIYQNGIFGSDIEYQRTCPFFLLYVCKSCWLSDSTLTKYRWHYSNVRAVAVSDDTCFGRQPACYESLFDNRK